MGLTGKILLFPAAVANIIVSAALIASAYSGILNPEFYPVLSLAGMAFPVLWLVNMLFLFFWLPLKNRGIWFSITAAVLTIPSALDYCPLHAGKALKSTGNADIELLSYNVYGFGFSKGVTGRGITDNPILSYIDGSEAGLICLQEANPHVLKAAMEGNRDFHERFPYSCNTEILTTLSRWPILDWCKISFPDTRNQCLYCRISVHGRVVAVINCHLQSLSLRQDEINDYYRMLEHPKDSLSYNGGRSVLNKLIRANVMRSGQISTLAELLEAETAEYIVVCGDFNDTPLSYAHHVMSKKLTDAYAAGGFGPGVTYNMNRLYFRIDHTFCSSTMETLCSRVDRSVSASDHYPVLTSFRLK